jgi:hypothetical protein
VPNSCNVWVLFRWCLQNRYLDICLGGGIQQLRGPNFDQFCQSSSHSSGETWSLYSYLLSSNPQWNFYWPLPHHLFLIPVVIECPLGRQAGGKFLAGPRDQDKWFFSEEASCSTTLGVCAIQKIQHRPLYLARLTYAGFVLCHFGCRIYVWRVTISSKERYYSLTKVYGWWW